ncbi:hypothetical protein N9934_01140 [Desulfosarcina sp.]|nr:hypothetical protein [Desulfosarcina sp.]
MQKRGDYHKPVVLTVILLFILSIGFMLFIVIDRYLGEDGLRTEFASKDGAYLFDAMQSANGNIAIKYHVDLSKSIFRENETFLEGRPKKRSSVIGQGLELSRYSFGLNKLNTLEILETDKESYFVKSGNHLYLTDENNYLNSAYSCEYLNPIINKIFVDPVKTDMFKDDFTYNALSMISSSVGNQYGTVITRAKGNNEPTLEHKKNMMNQGKDLSVYMGARVIEDYEEYIVIYSKGNLESNSLACYLANEFLVFYPYVAIVPTDIEPLFDPKVSVMIEFHFLDYNTPDGLYTSFSPSQIKKAIYDSVGAYVGE